jgi:hypothetical protein
MPGAAPAQKSGGSGKIVLLVLLILLVIGGGVAAVLIINNQGSTVTLDKPVLAKCTNVDGKAVVDGTITNKTDKAVTITVKADFMKDGTAATSGTTSLADVKANETRSFTVTGAGSVADPFKCSVTATAA